MTKGGCKLNKSDADRCGLRPDVFVIVPAYNEGEVVGEVIEGLKVHFCNVVVIDDGSSDDTVERARTAGAKVVSHPINLGQGAAIQTGMDYALARGANFVVTFDADGQHDPSDAAGMADRAKQEGLDVLLGSRFLGLPGDVPPARRFLLKAAVLFEKMATGAKLTDAHNGLRVIGAEAARSAEITLHGMSHASELTRKLTRKGLVVREHPVRIRYTEYSRKKGQRGLNAINILSDLFLKKLFR